MTSFLTADRTGKTDSVDIHYIKRHRSVFHDIEQDVAGRIVFVQNALLVHMGCKACQCLYDGFVALNGMMTELIHIARQHTSFCH